MLKAVVLNEYDAFVCELYCVSDVRKIHAETVLILELRWLAINFQSQHISDFIIVDIPSRSSGDRFVSSHEVK